ncbi:DUF937 domain-containing protein [Flavobacterium adhaerens]|uniref:DUF937 domain-containing protein n=1 Tax=Flavobacterium adhaerens TaxID=3149043 RepID=UPI0032B3F5A6
MAPFLLNQLRSVVTSPLISLFCKKYEENESVLKKSIDASFCTVLIGLGDKITNDALFEQIINSVALTEFYKSTEFENGKITSINYSFEEEGNEPLNQIFSYKKGRISEMISNEIGVKSETASAILNFATMLILTRFNNEIQKENNMLNSIISEKNTLLNTIPEGIRLILGYPNFEYEETHFNSDSLSKSNIKQLFFGKLFKI